jgi:hypothetical protein
MTTISDSGVTTGSSSMPSSASAAKRTLTSWFPKRSLTGRVAIADDRWPGADGLTDEIERAGFTGTAVYGVEGPGWPLRQEWADPQRRAQILFAARSIETQPSLIGFSDHLIAAATKL